MKNKILNRIKHLIYLALVVVLVTSCEKDSVSNSKGEPSGGSPLIIQELVDSALITIPTAYGSDTVLLNASNDWVASSDESWIVINPSSGTKDNSIVVISTTWEPAFNPAPEIREGVIVFSSDGIESDTLKVIQHRFFKADQYSACYIAWQRPARSIVKGEYPVGSGNTSSESFEMGVMLSGVYSNDIERKVYLKENPSLLNAAKNVKALPSDYYEIMLDEPIVIPIGSNLGKITIQLTNLFFEDSLSINREFGKVNYVIPLSIVGVEKIDSVLSGVPKDGIQNPNRIIENDWQEQPKDYTLLGVKYINEYDAIYFRTGKEVLYKDGNVVDSVFLGTSGTYGYETVHLISNKRKSVLMKDNRIRLGRGGYYSIELIFDEADNCDVVQHSSEDIMISGSGRFVANAELVNQKYNDAIYLNYHFYDEEELHVVSDTLIIRNRDIRLEEFEIELNE